MFQRDLKALLAYSTISHLGLITLLLGLNSPLAAVAAVFHVMNHATFKASLFMAAGIIDHETGTRDIRKLSGLMKLMPVTGTLAIIASASMAGVPLLNGFLSKEMFFAETVFIQSTPWVDFSLPVIATLAGVFSVAYSARFVFDVFFGPPCRVATPTLGTDASSLPPDVGRRRQWRRPQAASRAAALDACAGRAAGADLPGGGRGAGLVGRPAAGGRRTAGGGRCAARLQPGGVARLQPAAGDELRGAGGWRRAVPGTAPWPRTRAVSTTRRCCTASTVKRIFENLLARLSEAGRRSRASSARAACRRNCCCWCSWRWPVPSRRCGSRTGGRGTRELLPFSHDVRDDLDHRHGSARWPPRGRPSSIGSPR
jgi:hypothetical protein